MPKSGKSKVDRYVSSSGDANGFPSLVASLSAAERLGGVTYSDLRYTASLEETLDRGPPREVKYRSNNVRVIGHANRKKVSVGLCS